MRRLSFFVFTCRIEIALPKIYSYFLANLLVDELLHMRIISMVLIFLEDIHEKATFAIYDL